MSLLLAPAIRIFGETANESHLAVLQASPIGKHYKHWEDFHSLLCGTVGLEEERWGFNVLLVFNCWLHPQVLWWPQVICLWKERAPPSGFVVASAAIIAGGRHQHPHLVNQATHDFNSTINCGPGGNQVSLSQAFLIPLVSRGKLVLIPPSLS